MLLLTQVAVGQNNTNSPYTRFGYGEISDNNSGDQRAMGGVSIGSRSKNSINTVNPASYSAVDTMTFMFDIGTSLLASRFTNTNGSKTTINSNLEYLTMQFPLSKSVGFSAGLLPYSFSGYDFSKSDSIQLIDNTNETIYYSKQFNGKGGFSQVYSGLSVNLFNHIALGLNTYYMFGSYTNESSLYTSKSNDAIVQNKSISISNFRFRYGAQFFNTFAKKHDVTLGLIYEHKTKMNSTFTNVITGVSVDSIPNNFEFELPSMIGAGINYRYDKKLSVGLDYSLNMWRNTKYFWQPDSLKNAENLNNRSKISIGMEYIPNPFGRRYKDQIRYRAGFNMSDSYFNVNGMKPAQNFGITFGIGLPVYNKNSTSVSMLNASFEYGKIGTSELLREDYLKFTLNVTFSENWFFKRKL
jgi:hypothetical protein